MKDLENIEVIKGKCDDCILNDKQNTDYKNCSLNFFKMTGFHCAGWGQGKILKKKEQWVPCTKENVKVGRVIRRISQKNASAKIAYIFQYSKRIIVEAVEREWEVWMDEYEIQIKE